MIILNMCSYLDDPRDGHQFAGGHVIHQVSHQMDLQRAWNAPGVGAVVLPHFLQSTQ